MEVGTSKEMRDGTTAYLSNSKRFFIRREPEVDNWDTIRYYNHDGVEVQLAQGTCKNCGNFIKSRYCGHFVTCGCGKSFVDTSSSDPGMGRYGGDLIT
jgi:hypothetical protein